VRILGHLLGVPFSFLVPRSQEQEEKGFSSYLMILSSFRKGFNGLSSPLLSVFFLLFCSVFLPFILLFNRLSQSRSLHGFQLLILPPSSPFTHTCSWAVCFSLDGRKGLVQFLGSVLGREGSILSSSQLSTYSSLKRACMQVVWSLFLEGREVQLQQWLLLFLGERKSHLSYFLVFITLISVLGCLDTRPGLSLSPFWVILG